MEEVLSRAQQRQQEEEEEGAEGAEGKPEEPSQAEQPPARKRDGFEAAATFSGARAGWAFKVSHRLKSLCPRAT